MNDKKIFALGFFDGVHLGHQALLRECCALAERFHCEAAAITFDKHPKALFSGSVPALLSSVHDREKLLRRYGMDHIFVFPVTEAVMSTPWQDFLEELLKQGAAGFVCGDDFHFGHRGQGDSQKLLQFCAQRNLPCVIVPEQSLGGNRICSTLIRSRIEEGNMESATRYLGHPHMLTGKVVHGRRLGRTLGIPTANLLLPEGIVTPRFGVYACRAVIDGNVYPAVTNVGTRPTVSGTGITVEPWILDFEGDLYDREIMLEFYRFLRPETKFPDLSSLQQEIRKNAQETREYLQAVNEDH